MEFLGGRMTPSFPTLNHLTMSIFYRFAQWIWVVQQPVKWGFNLGFGIHYSNERKMTALSPHLFRTAPRLSNYSSTLLMLLTGLFALWIAMLHGSVPYTPDSANYIEQARSLLAGNGFESRPYWIDDIDVSQRPDKLFPPGYPLVIAVGSVLSGAPAEAVALWTNRLVLMALP